MKKVALIELGASHDECLYSQLAFLKEAGYWVSLICPQKLSNQVKDFPADELIFHDLSEAGKFSKWIKVLKFRKYLIKENFSKVIFNTASGNNVRNLLLFPFPSSIEFCGTIHHIQKLRNNSSQKVISRKLKKYFVLNDYLLRKLETEKTQLQFSSFYPIFFPNYPLDSLVKPDGEKWICIPGQVEFKRRDYGSLLEALDKNTINPKLKFILLGPCNHKDGNGKELREMIQQKGLDKHFLLFDGFIENNTYHAYLAKSDFILPLIHANNSGDNSYLLNQISGAFNLAFAYKKLLLCEETFSTMEDFQGNTLFYKLPELATLLAKLPSLERNKNLYQHPKWSFQFQQQSYINFINK